MNRECFDYCGIHCVDGSCPNCEPYANLEVDCVDCFYNDGCEDCFHFGETGCMFEPMDDDV